ncbi:MAG: ATP-binding cassette domain-containing protein, partial [Acidimicrobiales bacterium]
MERIAYRPLRRRGAPRLASLITLIGGNGAGKTTTLKTISGLRPLTSGSIRFDGADLAGVPAHRLVAMGISQAPEGRGIFAIIEEINHQGTTILLVEQNAAQALRRADRAYVLETGRVVRSAPAELADVTSEGETPRGGGEGGKKRKRWGGAEGGG